MNHYPTCHKVRQKPTPIHTPPRITSSSPDRNDEKSDKNISMATLPDSSPVHRQTSHWTALKRSPPVRRTGRTIEACAAHFVRSGVGEILCPDTDAPAKRTSETRVTTPRLHLSWCLVSHFSFSTRAALYSLLGKGRDKQEYT